MIRAALLVVLTAGAAQAAGWQDFYRPIPRPGSDLAVDAVCVREILDAQDRYDIPENILLAIGLQEAGIQREAIERRTETLDDVAVMQVIAQQAKQRRETLESVKTANRADVTARTTAELALLSAYLPEPLSEEALRAFIEEAVSAVGMNQGPIIKYVLGKAGGACEGRRVSQLVAERLSR